MIGTGIGNRDTYFGKKGRRRAEGREKVAGSLGSGSSEPRMCRVNAQGGARGVRRWARENEVLAISYGHGTWWRG